MNKKKITCVHLYNDFSGSPLVLSNTIRHFLKGGHEVEIMTSEGSVGFLSRIKGVRYRLFNYRFFENKRKRALALLRSQINLFMQVLKMPKDQIIYVNTLLPFGAALAGRMSGKKVIYHLHETTVNPPFLKSFLKWIARISASEIIYVSEFLRQQEPFPNVPSRVVSNSLSEEFFKRADRFLRKKTEKVGPFTVLMLCSMKEYKGYQEFIKLAEKMPNYRFLLVLNASPKEVSSQLSISQLSENLIVFPSQKDVHTFYQEADLVLNLSHPEKWIETFGMTLLEGMAYGLPVIAPPVGGPAELVENGVNGFQIDQRKMGDIKTRIIATAEDEALYKKLSENARRFARQFNGASMENQIQDILADT